MVTLSQAAARLTGADHRLMRRVQRWRPPRWIRWWMIAATRCGDGWLWAIGGLLLLFTRDPAGHSALLAAGLSVTAGILLFRKVKKSVRRPRPCELEPHCWATLLPPDQFSFPSGHTITAFAFAVSLGIYYPSLLPGLLFCATSVAASRVLLGMHFLSDVIAGAAIGTLLAYGSWALLMLPA